MTTSVITSKRVRRFDPVQSPRPSGRNYENVILTAQYNGGREWLNQLSADSGVSKAIICRVANSWVKKDESEIVAFCEGFGISRAHYEAVHGYEPLNDAYTESDYEEAGAHRFFEALRKAEESDNE
jgi:hypothetical protein